MQSEEEDKLEKLIKEMNELLNSLSEFKKWNYADFPKNISEVQQNILKLIKDGEKLERVFRKKINNYNSTDYINRRKVMALEEERDGISADFHSYEIQAKEVIIKLKQMNDELQDKIKPPRQYGTFLRDNEDEEGTVDVEFQGQRMQVSASEEERKELVSGQRVVLTPQGNVFKALDEFEERGEEATIDQVLENGRARIMMGEGSTFIVYLADSLKDTLLESGDRVLWDRKSGFIFDKLPKTEKSELELMEIADISYDEIGGQVDALAELEEYIEWPFLYADKFKFYHSKIPQGLLLYGPPGCGKTRTLKAVASSLRKRFKALGRKVEILNVRGPELLTKWVGESEERLRAPFELAEQKAKQGVFVIIFFDELESLFVTRGTFTGAAGVHENMVTQFSTLMDGVEEYNNILVVGATNRQDMIDPALTRPGRLYPLIAFPRPDKQGAKAIFEIYLNSLSDVINKEYIDPKHPNYKESYKKFEKDEKKVISKGFIPYALSIIFGEKLEVFDTEEEETFYKEVAEPLQKPIVRVEFQDTGEQKDIYLKDFISGALIESSVEQLKRKALEAEIRHGQEPGIKIDYLIEAIKETMDTEKAKISKQGQTEWARILDIPLERPFVVHRIKQEKEIPIEAQKSRRGI